MNHEWVWQDKNWPNFKFDEHAIGQLEQNFIENSGYLLGAFKHISRLDQEQMTLELVTDEAIETSAIEGEILDRHSVQESLRRNFGLAYEKRKIPASEQGIAYIMSDVYNNFSKPLTHELLQTWHMHLTSHRIDLNTIGSYRMHEDPMQIVSGAGNKIKIHYEAPPSSIILREMDKYINWYNINKTLSPLMKAGIAHLYFELIHPFEDGNGRIGRAIAEKSIAEYFNRPLLLSISKIIQQNKKQYYTELAACNHNLTITNWLIYFANTLIAAQQYSKKYIHFLIAKTKLYDRLQGKLNPRQEKVIARLFKAGLEGFKGGLSAENYISITDTTRSTATRDLQDLVQKGVLYKSGELKSTRYFLLLQTDDD